MRIIIFLISFCIFFQLISCSSAPLPSSQWKSDEIAGQNIILFIPGLFGSALADVTSGDRIYQTLGQALWGSTLALNGDLLGIADSRVLRAEALLESVSIIPGIYAADGYGESVRYLQNQFGKKNRVIPFFYDWREDDLRNVQKLGLEVRNLKKAGAKRIALVGHSLGGILISFYLRYGEQEMGTAKETWEGAKQVDLAVIAGTPFRGTLAAFRDLLHGTKVGLASKPLSAVALGSFPSYYEFLPPVQTYPELYKIENWQKWKMGLFSNTEDCTLEKLGARKTYTENNIKNGLKFNALLREEYKKPNANPIPYLAIVGTGYKTWSAVKDYSHWETNTEGDGLVTVESALVPTAYKRALRLEQITFNLEHRGMFTEKAVQEKVTAFLNGNGFY